MNYPIPKTQHALQLVGPDELKLNTKKPVFPPGPHQILCRVEAAGLCMSDLKLMKQFSGHARKSQIISGISLQVLEEIPSYVPGELPTVPGHEASVRVWGVGEKVKFCKPGERYLVQTDYRWLRTASSNAAFGYNFEGALQEYVLLDERIITSPEGEFMLIPASESLSASAVALVEPWACVEDAYAEKQRKSIDGRGKMLIVADAQGAALTISDLLLKYGKPKHLNWIYDNPPDHELGVKVYATRNLNELKDNVFEDIVYFGSRPDRVEALLSKLAPRGLINIVLCGGKLGRPVVCPVGRVHYGGIRIIGTTGSDPVTAMDAIPTSAEIRNGDRIHIVGAGGPMGVMHVIRDLCEGIPGIEIFAGDTENNRLSTLNRLAMPLAQKYGLSLKTYNPLEQSFEEKFNYIALMAPIPALVAQAVKQSADRAIINIFAGIPAEVTDEIDLDAYIEKQIYFIGTSGSVLDDMKAVLAKVEAGALDTNFSMAAVSGLDGAVKGIKAIENREMNGKVIVYPGCKGLDLVALDQIGERLPEVANYLTDGFWNHEAENSLLNMCGSASPPPAGR